MRTVGDIISEARALLNDPIPSGSGSTFSGTPTSRTVANAIAEVRGLLNDTGTNGLPYRYPDDDLYDYFSNALLHVRRSRPDLFEAGVTLATPIYDTTTASMPFPIDEVYYPAFVQYVVASAEIRDDTAAQDQKSVQLAQGFMHSINSAPFRYSDTFLYGMLNDAVGEMRRNRPDLFHGQMRSPQTLYSPLTPTLAMPVDESYFTMLVDYVVARARFRNRDITPADGAEGPNKPPADYGSMFSRKLRVG